MKYRVGLLFTALLCILLCLGAAAETFTWADTAETPNLSASGYPRFAKRADGTLLLADDNGYIYHSTDNGKSWTRQTAKATAAATTSKTTASGVTHTLTCANLQPYVLPDGKVLLSYRCHTRSYASGEFYTSIRVMTSTDGGVTFGNEKILVEATSPSSMHGFWEPFVQRIAPDKIALYYADDLCVNLIPSQQRIAYLTYTISTGAWSTEPAVAIYRPDMKSRDGMPTTAALSDGGFAMEGPAAKKSVIDGSMTFKELASLKGQELSGDYSFRINETDFNITENMTISEVMNQINTSGAGVKMSIDDATGAFIFRNSSGTEAIRLEGAIFGKDSVTGIEAGEHTTAGRINRSDSLQTAARKLGHTLSDAVTVTGTVSSMAVSTSWEKITAPSIITWTLTTSPLSGREMSTVLVTSLG